MLAHPTRVKRKGETVMRADARAKRAQIIAAAMEQYRTLPASEVTMEGIAADAGVGIATVYRHFPSRATLRQACAIGFIDLFDEFLASTLAAFDASPEEEWERFVWRLVDYGVGMLVAELAAEIPAATDETATAARERFYAQVSQLLEKAAAHGLVDPDLTPAELASELIVVTRPMDAQFTELFPDVRDRLVRHLLAAWRCAPAA